MAGQLSAAINNLCSDHPSLRRAAAAEIYHAGRVLADPAVRAWWDNAALAALLLAPHPAVTVGLAVHPETFARIREASGTPALAQAPPHEDAEEFELHFAGEVSLDVLTTQEPAGAGAIARFLKKFGEGVQQVEFRCTNVDRAVEILKEQFGLTPVYPHPRPGADNTRINFFLVPSPPAAKVLVELYEPQAMPL